MRTWLRRVWCKFWHHGLWKTEEVAGRICKRRCLECEEIYFVTLPPIPDFLR